MPRQDREEKVAEALKIDAFGAGDVAHGEVERASCCPLRMGVRMSQVRRRMQSSARAYF